MACLVNVQVLNDTGHSVEHGPAQVTGIDSYLVFDITDEEHRTLACLVPVLACHL